MKGFLAEFPSEIVEAALMDGTSHPGIIIRIILPLTFAGIIATASLAFLQTWNEFILASFLTTSHTQTLPILISDFIGDNSFFWSEQTAASVISVIPPLIIILLVQKQLVRGLTLGAIKT
jgi:multiple sugar transport system permease protein